MKKYSAFLTLILVIIVLLSSNSAIAQTFTIECRFGAAPTGCSIAWQQWKPCGSATIELFTFDQKPIISTIVKEDWSREWFCFYRQYRLIANHEKLD